LEKKLAQHKTAKRILRCKLETYQEKIPNFICGGLTSIEVSGQNEDIEAWPNGIAQEEEV
jgi:hypothetical protein